MLDEGDGKQLALQVCRHALSPLQWAVLTGNFEAAEILLVASADVNFALEGASALQLAISSGRKCMVELFLKRGAEANKCSLTCSAMLLPATANHGRIRDFIYRTVAQPDDVDTQRLGLHCCQTSSGSLFPLELACLLGQLEMVGLLLRNGEGSYALIGQL